MLSAFTSGIHSLPAAPFGIPFGAPTQNLIVDTVEKKPKATNGEDLPRALSYLADYGGCGYYRCLAPNFLLNLYQKAITTDVSCMLMDPRIYKSVRAVKFQRQATTHQKQFIRDLKEYKNNFGFKTIYEVDDVIISKYIPIYNRNKHHYDTKEIQTNILEILSEMDEIIVTTEYFKNFLKNETGLTNITSVPNYLMRWWFDRYYNLGDLVKNFEKNKKKPTIAIFASGTHVDVLNRNGGVDDFTPVLKQIISTIKDFNWHFVGCYPLQLKPYIDRGDVKYTKWVDLPKFPELMKEVSPQLTFASLLNNEFNNCKSNIKLIEAGAFGIPCVCPNSPAYSDAILKYNTGSDFIDIIKTVLKNQTTYAEQCKKARALANNYWLDDAQNLMKHHEVYFTPFGSKDRNYLT